MNLFDNKMYIIDVKVNGLKINMKIGVSIQCFRRRPQHVALWRLMFWLWQIKIANDVYFQSCQLMLHGLNRKIKFLKITIVACSHVTPLCQHATWFNWHSTWLRQQDEYANTRLKNNDHVYTCFGTVDNSSNKWTTD